jgi:hypothetical protein
MNYATESFSSGASLRGKGRAVNNRRNKTTLTDSGMQIAVERPQQVTVKDRQPDSYHEDRKGDG